MSEGHVAPFASLYLQPFQPHQSSPSCVALSVLAPWQVEDLLEYYLQRSSATQSEAERLLEGARDLEESIGVSLSARR